MAGPFFELAYFRDPKTAAKNVQCIHTSVPAGTSKRDCHQDWLMGKCGLSQEAGNGFQAMICDLTKNCTDATYYNHNICPYFYNSAFTNDFKANTSIKCASLRLAKNLPKDFKMGFMETRRRYKITRYFFCVAVFRAKKINKNFFFSPSIIGDIPSPTSKTYPYNVV